MNPVPVVTTIEHKCKRCYSCVRNCPAKAIKVENGQAKVMAERCIACGYCVRVCSQNAKKIRDDLTPTLEFLNQDTPVVAILAPSFPAAFPDNNPDTIIAALAKAGFSKIFPVALGADIVSYEYQLLYQSQIMPVIISSPCPAIVNYIEKYDPALTLCLAPIVSPMIATGRFLKQAMGESIRIVFIGPCIAKKKEMTDKNVSGVIDAVLTFEEVKKMFEYKHIEPEKLSSRDFDGPDVNWGRLFPVSGGLLKSADLQFDIMDNDVIITEGRDRVMEILQKSSNGEIEAKFLDLLFCEGCINGPKIDSPLSVFVKKDKIVNYIKTRENKKSFKNFTYPIDCKRRFSNDYQQMPAPTQKEIQNILYFTGKRTSNDELNCGACGYNSCREKAIAVFQGLAEAEMCLPFLVEKLETIQRKLETNNKELNSSIEALKRTQEQLVQSEKMASVGQLAAGVAHELNNPLGGIMVFANLLLEQKDQNDPDRSDLARIIHEAERCKAIIYGLLDFSRQSHLQAAIVNLNKIILSTLDLVKHQSLFQKIDIKIELEPTIGQIFADVGLLQQIFLNIIFNAAEAMEGEGCFLVSSCMSNDHKYVIAEFSDTGPGMSNDIVKRIFDPFFTTKPPGQGTGLGLSMCYSIIKRHKGEIKVSSKVGEGTTITIQLPNSIEIEKDITELYPHKIYSL